jgi:hypothetical protein
LKREAELVALERERKVADDSDQAHRLVLLAQPVDGARLVPRERVESPIVSAFRRSG